MRRVCFPGHLTVDFPEASSLYMKLIISVKARQMCSPDAGLTDGNFNCPQTPQYLLSERSFEIMAGIVPLFC